MSRILVGGRHGENCKRRGQPGVGTRSAGASANRGAVAAGAIGRAAAGLRVEPGANGARHRPLGALDVPAAQPFPGGRDRWRRPAPVARWAPAPEHDRRARARVAGTVPGARQHGRHSGRRSGQGRDRSAPGALDGAVLGLQPAAPARLAKARAGQASPAKRPAGSGGVEKNSPNGSPKSARSGPTKPRSG